jgi:ABC-2 type transport system permease protein
MNIGMNKEERKYSQLTAMFAISAASLKSMLRSPSSVIFTVAFPLIFIIVFGFINGGRIRLDVGIDPRSDTTGFVYKVFSESPSVQIERNFSMEELNHRLDRGRLDALVYFHPLDNGHQSIEVTKGKASAEKAAFVESVLSNIIAQQNIQTLKKMTARSSFDQEEVISELKESIRQGPEYKMIDFILPGQLGFSILSAGVFGTAFVFFSLRQTLVLKRFFATPVKRMYIVLGEALSRLIFQLAGAAVIIFIGRYAFGFTLIHGLTTALQMLLLSALGLIVFMGFGFVVSGLAKNESVIPPIANIVTLPQFLLSGTFFPIDAFPDWLQYVSKALPLTYLNDAMRKVAFEGAGFSDISVSLLVLVGWGIIIYTAAVRVFRWE